MARVYIKGIPKVVANLNKEVLKIKGRSMGGLIRGVALIRRDMETTPPLIPVDWGNLRASWFSISGTGSSTGTSAGFKGPQGNRVQADHQEVLGSVRKRVSGTMAIGFGFSAFYSGLVHEDRSPKNWSRPGSGPKFMEEAIERNKLAVLEVIRQHAKIR